VPVLLVVLLVLLAGGAFLWFARPEESAVRTDDYAKALQAARSG
jgi:Mce-associated membrane protein